jgi:UDP-glucose 4-epimerase
MSEDEQQAGLTVLVTGAAGYIGSLVTKALLGAEDVLKVIAVDRSDIRLARDYPGTTKLDFHRLDIRSTKLSELIEESRPEVLVHLAAVVSPPPGMGREELHAIDVAGTEKVLEACVRAGVQKVIVTSSGAAYGYHADNAPLLDEDQPLRGNVEFAYSDNKRLVEELLARYRREHPQLRQLIFRPGTILGKSVSNQITALFEKPFVLGLRESATPFVFTYDRDLVQCIQDGTLSDKAGIYNLVSDGVMTLREIAASLGKPFVPAPTAVVETALRVLKRFALTQYGPEQTRFLQYRPVMSNERLKKDFGFRPTLSSRQVFDLYKESHAS